MLHHYYNIKRHLFQETEGLLTNQGKQARDGYMIVLDPKKCCTTPIVFCTTPVEFCTTLNLVSKLDVVSKKEVTFVCQKLLQSNDKPLIGIRVRQNNQIKRKTALILLNFKAVSCYFINFICAI